LQVRWRRDPTARRELCPLSPRREGCPGKGLSPGFFRGFSLWVGGCGKWARRGAKGWYLRAVGKGGRLWEKRRPALGIEGGEPGAPGPAPG
jgi:hypothetical protein